jgi:putative two-component system response regulator
MRKTILIVDDEELNRELLKQMFESDFNILEAADGREALIQIGKHMNEIAIILLDIIMPVCNGYQLLGILNSKGILAKIPVVLITAQDDEQTEHNCYSLGATAVISKPFKAEIVRKRIMSTIELYNNMEQLEGTVEQQQSQLMEQYKKLEAYQEKLMEVVSNIVEFRDLETGEHVKRVKGFTKIMAMTYMRLYPESGLDKHKVDVIVRASALHDIGKIAIPDKILLKPGRLTEDERQIMMGHTTKGCDILNMLKEVQDDEQFQASYDICRHHHERYDGGGYPDGLKGDDIPISAQIVSLVDVYDALVSERVYKKPLDKETAYNMIFEGKCGVFNPRILKCFEVAKKSMETFSDSQK